jgi:hypothetical protein
MPVLALFSAFWRQLALLGVLWRILALLGARWRLILSYNYGVRKARGGASGPPAPTQDGGSDGESSEPSPLKRVAPRRDTQAVALHRRAVPPMWQANRLFASSRPSHEL